MNVYIFVLIVVMAIASFAVIHGLMRINAEKHVHFRCLDCGQEDYFEVSSIPYKSECLACGALNQIDENRQITLRRRSTDKYPMARF